MRRAAIRDALAFLAVSGDPSITGATLLLPDGQAVYLEAASARDMLPPRGGVH